MTEVSTESQKLTTCPRYRRQRRRWRWLDNGPKVFTVKTAALAEEGDPADFDFDDNDDDDNDGGVDRG